MNNREAVMHYKCSFTGCGAEIEHEPHPTIAACPKCGRRGTFRPITPVDEPVDEITTDSSEERAPRRRK